MAGLFVVPLTPFLRLRLKRLFGCGSRSEHRGRCCCLGGLMQEALRSDALSPAMLCHQDRLLPHLQDV